MKHLPKGQLPNPKQRFPSLQAHACSGDWILGTWQWICKAAWYKRLIFGNIVCLLNPIKTNRSNLNNKGTMWGCLKKMDSQQTVLTSPQQEWELQGDDKTHSDKNTRMTCWLQKYLQWLHCLSSTKDETIFLMFLVSPMTSQNEDLVISCGWVLKG